MPAPVKKVPAAAALPATTDDFDTKPITAAQSVVAVMRAVSNVAKREVNSHQNYKFRGIDAVVNAVGPALRNVGGFITQSIIEARYERGITNKGGATIEVFATIAFEWHGTDGGEPIVSTIIAEATDISDKATAKVSSVALRTFLLQILMLPTDDPDQDSDYHQRGTIPAGPAPAVAAAVLPREAWVSYANNAPTTADAVKVWQRVNVLVKEGKLRQDLLDEVGVICQTRRDSDLAAEADAADEAEAVAQQKAAEE